MEIVIKHKQKHYVVHGYSDKHKQKHLHIMNVGIATDLVYFLFLVERVVIFINVESEFQDKV